MTQKPKPKTKTNTEPNAVEDDELIKQARRALENILKFEETERHDKLVAKIQPKQ